MKEKDLKFSVKEKGDGFRPTIWEPDPKYVFVENEGYGRTIGGTVKDFVERGPIGSGEDRIVLEIEFFSGRKKKFPVSKISKVSDLEMKMHKFLSEERYK